ncbi:MAG: hypothetical protein QME12_09580, partial [Nanoarchaeota archaeon]|nr:hypothetical protein [Nanoarchaeota archaeon]
MPANNQKKRKRGDNLIRKKCFWHGWKYDYGLHEPKTNGLLNNSFSGLKDYLNSLFLQCPDNYFLEGPRGSKLRFQMPNLDVRRHNDHEVSLLCTYGLGLNAERFNTEHMKVQMFMLENDKKTIAMEVPVWLLPDETKEYSQFRGNFALTGHIDLL